eukprot:Gregarina_sp_Poly_1__3707@NODE_2096_length_2691_cov_49_213796_g1352_i0_p2_GENE_NODE_2096_length_2691_cov_49_213796_g1352_i0NODE_2096_length_2691_cov_49_213796_g1352_i0_p2_ORF_typecomplete_len385_score35_33_NODE_2096_length_2691_cov_49_213796_g1352_i01081262
MSNWHRGNGMWINQGPSRQTHEHAQDRTRHFHAPGGRPQRGGMHHSYPAETTAPHTPKQPPSNPYFQYINATAPEQIPARVYELCRSASVMAESVIGVSGCILAWKPHTDITLVIRAMTDAYCHRATPPPSKLAITYIFNDLVQKDPATFAEPGLRYFFQVIAPLVSFLPQDVQGSHCRVLDVLRDRGIYSKDQTHRIRRTFTLDRSQDSRYLGLSAVGPATNPCAELEVDNESALKGKISATLRATRAFCSDPRTADAAIVWANSLLTAAGGSPTSTHETFNVLDIESRKALQAAITRALTFVSLELELLQYFIVDWCVCVEENQQRLLRLANFLTKELTGGAGGGGMPSQSPAPVTGQQSDAAGDSSNTAAALGSQPPTLVD